MSEQLHPADRHWPGAIGLNGRSALAWALFGLSTTALVVSFDLSGVLGTWGPQDAQLAIPAAVGLLAMSLIGALIASKAGNAIGGSSSTSFATWRAGSSRSFSSTKGLAAALESYVQKASADASIEVDPLVAGARFDPAAENATAPGGGTSVRGRIPTKGRRA